MNNAVGRDALEFMDNLLTPEEIAESNFRVALIGELIKARQEKGLSQKKLAELSGIKQPIISRMESGKTSPQIDTVLKVLAPLGMTLKIVKFESNVFESNVNFKVELPGFLGRKGDEQMPTISMFYGIIIRMYNNGEHNPPHFHATYQEYNAIFNMDGELTDGEMPKKQLKLISAWAEIHRDELLANWELAMNEQPLYKIDPLR